MSSPILGILGGGQLGRMLALAAARLGVRTRVIDPSSEACAGDVAELVTGGYADERALDRFCDGLDAATVEFENVPLDTVRRVASRVPFHPGSAMIEWAQDRVLERDLFEQFGLRTPKCCAARTAEEVAQAYANMGGAAILKSRRFGYDGKGQAWIRSPDDVGLAWESIGRRPAMLDEAVRFDRELSLVMVRGASGEVRHYAPTENVHVDGILHRSVAPAEVEESGILAVRRSIENMLEKLNYVGVMATEIFDCDGEYLVNECAPRVHNSGHWTIEGAQTSQFENHVRAVMGLPLGSTASRGHAGMVNLIGSVGEVSQLLACDGACVHVYGKDARAGRKVGHVTVCADDAFTRDAQLDEIERKVASGVEHVDEIA